MNYEQLLFRQHLPDLLKNYTDKEVAKLTGWLPCYIKKKRKLKKIRTWTLRDYIINDEVRLSTLARKQAENSLY